MNIQRELILKAYFKILNETFLLAYNIKTKPLRNNFLKKINSQYSVFFQNLFSLINFC